MPLPRYLTAPFCPDQDHAPSRTSDSLEKSILSGLERLKKSVKDFLFFSGIRMIKVVVPLWLVAGPTTINANLQASIDTLWENDPVHPTEDGFWRLLAGLRTTALVELMKSNTEGTRNDSQGHRRITHPEWRPRPCGGDNCQRGGGLVYAGRGWGHGDRGSGGHAPSHSYGLNRGSRGSPRGRGLRHGNRPF